METAVALIAFFVITILVMPNLLTREVLLLLIVLGILSVVRPGLVAREYVIALVAFGVLFSLIVPELTKK
jgi:hypothetical protein